MKKAKEIFKSFSNSFVAAFTGTCLCDVEHEVFGKHQLTSQQVKNSSGEYKNLIYKNICEQIDLEIIAINSGEYGDAKDEPIVNSPLVKLLAKNSVDGIHDLNRWIKYPELMQIVDELASQNIELEILPEKVKDAVRGVDSKMTYKAQFVWECLGTIMGFTPA